MRVKRSVFHPSSLREAHKARKNKSKKQEIKRNSSFLPPLVKKGRAHKGLLSREVKLQFKEESIFSYKALRKLSGAGEEFDAFFERSGEMVKKFTGFFPKDFFSTEAQKIKIFHLFTSLFNKAYFDAKKTINEAHRESKLLDLRVKSGGNLKILPKEIFKFNGLRRLRGDFSFLSEYGKSQLKTLKKQNPNIKITL